MGWTFEGTKHFIGQAERLERHREWLLQLIGALEGEKTRDAIVAALREAAVGFQP